MIEKRHRGPIAIAIATAALLAPAAPAGAEQVRLPAEVLGSAEQPALASPQSLAVYQSGPDAGDVLVADLGGDEEQEFNFTGFSGGDTFTVGGLPGACSEPTTAPVEYASGPKSTTRNRIKAALEEKCGANFATTALGYGIIFEGVFAEAPQELLTCGVESGSGGCSVSRKQGGGVGGIRRFHADGTPDPFAALGTNVIDGRSGADETPTAELALGSGSSGQIAIDESSGPAAGDIYVPENGKSRASIFADSGEFLGRLEKAGATPFNPGICGAGVDAAGHAYIVEENAGKVYPFAPLGNPAGDGDYEAPPFAGAEGPCNVLVGAGPSAGFLFLSEAGAGAGQSGFSKWRASDRARLWKRQPPGAGSAGLRNYALALDPASGDPFLVNGDKERIEEYDGAAESAGEAGVVSVAAAPGGARGIAVRGASDRLYASRLSDEGLGQVQIYGPPVTLPTLATCGAEAAAHGATLCGTVDPEGVGLSDCRFEYVSNSQYGVDGFESAETADCEPEATAVPTGSGPQEVKAAIGGLDTRTVYRFRLLAANADGSGASEPPESFETNPLETREAEPVGGAKATLNGAVFPGGEAIAECLFEWGESTAYGHTAPCEPEAALIPTGAGEQAVKAKIEGLTPDGATYHFRLKATGGFGAGGSHSFEGEDRSLETAETVATKPATGIGPEGLTLKGAVDPEEVPIAACLFEYGPTESYGSTAACVPAAGEISGEAPVEVAAHLGELAPGTTVHYRLAATYEGIPGPIRGREEAAKTLGPPAIEEQWADRVLFSEATLGARIVPEGLPTSYRIEYGSEATYGHSTPSFSLGKEEEDRAAHTLAHALEGLAPGTTYHYRFLATNAIGASAGEDHSFTTYAHVPPETSCANAVLREESSSTSLPDCRAYEMVSPLDKNGGGVGYGWGLMQSAADGDKLAFPSASSFAGNGSNSAQPNHYIATRGAAGWSTRGIDPPLEVPGLLNSAALGPISFFYAYTPDLRTAWLYNGNRTPLAASAPAGVPQIYRREDPGGALTPLAIATPAELPIEAKQIELAGYSEDLSKQIFEYPGALTADAAAGKGRQIYEYAGGALHLVSVLPGGTAAARAEALTSGANGPSEQGLIALRGAVAREASRVFWIAPASNSRYYRTGTVYVRIDPLGAGAQTVQLSPGGHSAFLGASRDGSRALLDSEGELELVSDTASGARTAIASLSRMSAPGANGGYHNGLLGASADLSRVYFISGEARDGGEAGAFNLYGWHGGAFTLIGELDEYDAFGADVSGVGGVEAKGTGVLPGPAGVEPRIHSSSVSADGLRVAFTSSSPAMAARVGYDNADATDGEAAREVYLYDAAAPTGSGLTCVSCNPSGARPRADRGRQPEGPGTFSSKSQPPSSPRAAVLPSEGNSSLNPRRPLSADGRRVLFESYDPLVPADTNGTWDVYEWEAPGKGSCHAGDPDYFFRDRGCINLLSSGRSREASQLIDADPEGANAFIRTTSSIDPRDEGAYDAYDARIGGGFALPAALAPCEGEACQNAPAAPATPTPASSAFRGAGDIGPHGSCAAAARRARRLSHHARWARRRARRSHDPRQARRARHRARRLAHRAHRTSAQAKRCRRANRKRRAR